MRPLARPPFWGRAGRSLGRSLGHSPGRATESQIPLKRVRGRQQPKSAMFNIRDKLLEPFSPLPRTALENAQPVRGRQEPHIAIAIRFLFRKHFFARLQNARVSFPFFRSKAILAPVGCRRGRLFAYVDRFSYVNCKSQGYLDYIIHIIRRTLYMYVHACVCLQSW